MFCFLPVILTSSTYTIRIILVFCGQRSTPNSVLPFRLSPNRKFSNCQEGKWVSIKISLKRNHGWPLVSYKTYPDICTFFGILSNFGASSILPCKRILLLLLVHKQVLQGHPLPFAAICDADEPCSVKTACEPVSSFTVSPCITTLPLYY